MTTFRAPSPVPTNEEIKTSHSIDRSLYKRLVIDLGGDIMLGMKAAAFWMWLEEVGFPDIASSLLKLDDEVLSLIYDEAVGCVKCMESSTPPFFSPAEHNVVEIPVTKRMVSPFRINITSLYRNRVSVLRRINKTGNEVFPEAFDDIIQHALQNNPQRTNSPEVPSAPHHVPNDDETSILKDGAYFIGNPSVCGNPSFWKYVG